MNHSSPQIGSKEKKRFLRGDGFSLIEVVIAMGVLVFALIGVFGLIQGGLQTYRDAMDTTIAGSISQQAIARCLVADFKHLSDTLPQTNFFDERGLALPGSAADRAIFVSVTQLLPETEGGVDLDKLVKIHLTVTSPVRANFKKSFVSLIARQESRAP